MESHSPQFAFCNDPEIRVFYWHMRDSENIYCPFCGQENTMVIDTTVSSQRFCTDCEVCCRPFEVVVECEEGELVEVYAMGDS